MNVGEDCVRCPFSLFQINTDEEGGYGNNNIWMDSFQRKIFEIKLFHNYYFSRLYFEKKNYLYKTKLAYVLVLKYLIVFMIDTLPYNKLTSKFRQSYSVFCILNHENKVY